MRSRRFLSKNRVVMVWVNDFANRCRLSSNGVGAAARNIPVEPASSDKKKFVSGMLAHMS